MSKTIALTNQKGGVAKTTTCINLACALHQRGRRVLICDCDPQGNCTSGMGVDKNTRPNVYDVLINGADPAEIIVRTKYGDILPSNRQLSGASVELVALENSEYILKNALAQVKDGYDYIFIDCPPSLELLTLNALAAADSVIVPVQCEYYAMEGLADLVTTLKMTNRRLNPRLEIEGLVMTMYDARTNFAGQVVAEVRNYFGDKVYDTMIPRSIRLAEAPSHGMPGIVYDKISKGTRAYRKLASEFLKRERGG